MKKLLFSIIAAATILAGAAIASARSDKAQLARSINTFNAVLKELDLNYVDSIHPDRLVRTAIDAMLADIDPYTEYYPVEDSEDLTAISTGRYGGIGAYIRKRPEGVIIAQPMYGAPAHLAGLRHGDRILAVDSVTVTPDMSSDRVTRLLKGQAGSPLTIKVARPYTDPDSILTFTFTRGNVDLEPMPYAGVDSAGVGYIKLNTFNDNSAARVRTAVEQMLARPDLSGIILDLRGNGGGLLESAVQIAGLFVPKGTEIVRTRGADGKNLKIYKTTHAPIAPNTPLVVMTDGSTASASEILAGSLQDLDRAVIVGERSYGKGLVQVPRPLPYDGLLKVTVARYYIPSGRLIQAIDYSHRNPDGSPARIPDSLTRVWPTAHGRQVRDGGGITPDITAADTTMNRMLYNVIADDWAFNYATRYRATHPSIPDADTWQVDDSLFADFKAFIDPSRFKYDRMCESGIDFLRKAVVTEGYAGDSVTAAIDALAALLRHDLNHDLDFNRPKLTALLDDEISQRYYDDADHTRRMLRYDAPVDTARAVLLDPARYRQILTPTR